MLHSRSQTVTPGRGEIVARVSGCCAEGSSSTAPWHCICGCKRQRCVVRCHCQCIRSGPHHTGNAHRRQLRQSCTDVCAERIRIGLHPDGSGEPENPLLSFVSQHGSLMAQETKTDKDGQRLSQNSVQDIEYRQSCTFIIALSKN
jgi:hypothetical protein